MAYKLSRLTLMLLFTFNTSIHSIAQAKLTLHLRTKAKDEYLKNHWESKDTIKEISPYKAAIIICDMWDAHWCKDAAERSYFLANKIDAVISIARAQGIKIIHAPSETLHFYERTKQRLEILRLPHIALPPIDYIDDQPLRVCNNRCYCWIPCSLKKDLWSCEQFPVVHMQPTALGHGERQNSLIHIKDEDFISDDISEIYSFIKHKEIEAVFIIGQHLNLCIFGRPFGIKAMKQYEINIIVIRDLVLTFPNHKIPIGYNDQHELFIQWLEKYWCPTIHSSDITTANKNRLLT